MIDVSFVRTSKVEDGNGAVGFRYKNIAKCTSSWYGIDRVQNHFQYFFKEAKLCICFNPESDESGRFILEIKAKIITVCQWGKKSGYLLSYTILPFT